MNCTTARCRIFEKKQKTKEVEILGGVTNETKRQSNILVGRAWICLHLFKDHAHCRISEDLLNLRIFHRHLAFLIR